MLSGEEEKGLRRQCSFGAELLLELVVLWIWRVFRSAGLLSRPMDFHFLDDSRLPSDQPLGGQNADTLSALGWLCRLSQLGDLSAQSIRQRFCKI